MEAAARAREERAAAKIADEISRFENTLSVNLERAIELDVTVEKLWKQERKAWGGKKRKEPKSLDAWEEVSKELDVTIERVFKTDDVIRRCKSKLAGLRD